MYLQSSNSRKGKILTVAMEVNEDYRSYREFSVAENLREYHNGSTC
jgi:hypothetical protein